MIKGKTSSSFEFEIDEGLKDDMELVDAIAEAMGENSLAISKVCLMVFGKEQRKRLYDFLRDENGRVSAEAVSECTIEAIKASGDAGKN